MATKVFIVDDHFMVIEGIRSLIQNDGSIEWMGHATHANSCLSFLQNQLPDVILMDVSMPDMNGIDLCGVVKQKYPSVFILGLSTFNQQSFIQKMVDNGASGYLLKNATKDELLEGIRTVMKGKIYYSAEAAQSLRNNAGPKTPVITRRQKEMLELIAAGMTNNEIAAKLFISAATVDTRRKNLLARFEVKNTAALIKTAIQLGLIE
jgi:DNA-binding NarL/FixJ family response regulator